MCPDGVSWMMLSLSLLQCNGLRHVVSHSLHFHLPSSSSVLRTAKTATQKKSRKWTDEDEITWEIEINRPRRPTYMTMFCTTNERSYWTSSSQYVVSSLGCYLNKLVVAYFETLLSCMRNFTQIVLYAKNEDETLTCLWYGIRDCTVSILLKLDGVGVFATAPCVSYHADNRAQRAGQRSELCTPIEASPLPLAPGRLVQYIMCMGLHVRFSNTTGSTLFKISLTH